jgi:hypothetical protein
MSELKQSSVCRPQLNNLPLLKRLKKFKRFRFSFPRDKLITSSHNIWLNAQAVISKKPLANKYIGVKKQPFFFKSNLVILCASPPFVACSSRTNALLECHRIVTEKKKNEPIFFFAILIKR